MSETGNTGGAITRFVRDSLGCTCPDEVFHEINVIRDSGLFAGANTVYEIGGRLLVAVIVPAHWHDIEADLARFVDAGRQYRDKHGYNRFRLVVAADDEAAVRRLPLVFDGLSNTDDRTHLHVIDPQRLPRHGRG